MGSFLNGAFTTVHGIMCDDITNMISCTRASCSFAYDSDNLRLGPKNEAIGILLHCNWDKKQLTWAVCTMYMQVILCLHLEGVFYFQQQGDFKMAWFLCLSRFLP